MRSCLSKRFFALALTFAMFVTCIMPMNVFAASETERYPLKNANVTYDIATKKVAYENVIYATSDTTQVNSKNENFTETQNTRATGNWGTIDNTTGSPYRNICWVKSTFSNGKIVYGSGVLVDFDVMLTSGELVYSHNNGGWASQIEVVPGKKGNSNPLGTAFATNMTTNNSWINNMSSAWNWGLVDLNNSFSTYQLYTYYTNPSDMVLKNIVEYVYPNNSNQFYSETFIINATDSIINHYAKINGTGGAIIDSSTERLVGIDTGYTIMPLNGDSEYRESVRINADLYNRIRAHCGN